jgi:two-component system CheB/CheR fusion protein
MTDGEARSKLVIIGASAGGIEALSILVGTLQPDFPAPIVIAQHLDPRRESHLTQILARRTSLPVVTVEDEAPLTPGVIHVVPSNRHVSVTDHEVALAPPPPDGRPVPSVDHVLATAAEKFGEGLIAVVLTGTGSDGADGARRVKLMGGTVVIQDPDTARFPSMPNSLAPTSVDIAASIEAIGPLLHELVTESLPTRPEEERLLEPFLEEVRARSGIDFASYKRPTILRRLHRRILATQSENLRSYIRYTGKHPEEFQRLTSSFLIKVTEFFRDAELFDHLRDVVLPDAITRARGEDRELRLWSAGCATGEEAFSLAILLAEALGAELDQWTVRIFATDVDVDAINYARQGIYPAAAVEHLPPQIVERYFTKLDGEYAVNKQIRALTVFGQHDLALRAPFPRIDLALCRNVLIYFTPELQRRALQLFAFSLRDGAWLVLGKAETTNPLAEHFVLDDNNLKIFRRRGERPLIPPMRTPDVRGTRLPRITPRTAPSTVQRPLAAPAAVAARRPLDRADPGIAVLPFGVVTVDRTYDIASINPAARRLLTIHGAAIGQDLIHLASTVSHADLRAALDEALAGRSTTVRVQAQRPMWPSASERGSRSCAPRAARTRPRADPRGPSSSCAT